MGYTSKSVASGHRARVSSRLSGRSHLATGGALASAGILALGLVAAPSDSNGARTEVRAVQLAALGLPPAAHLGALEKFSSDQARTVVHVTKIAADGAADIPPSVVKTPTAAETTLLTFDSAIDPAISSQQVNDAALAATTADWNPTTDPILGPIVSFFGGLLLFLPVAVLVILACPPCALFNVITGLIQSFLIDLTPVPAVAAPFTATAQANATNAPTLTSDPQLSDSARVNNAPLGIPAASAGDTAQLDISQQTTPTSGKQTSDTDQVTAANDEVTDQTKSKGAIETDQTKSKGAIETDQTPSKDTAIETDQTLSTGTTTGTQKMSTDTATSTKDVAETAEADERSAGPTAASAPEPSPGASTSKRVKPAVRPATPRHVVRDSLGVGEQLRDRPHRPNSGRPTTPPGGDAGDS